jgi:hypothetical protein
VLHRFLGFWLLRRAFRLVTADDPRPLRERLTREAKRVLVAAALLVVAVVFALVILVVVLVVSVA